MNKTTLIIILLVVGLLLVLWLRGGDEATDNGSPDPDNETNGEVQEETEEPEETDDSAMDEDEVRAQLESATVTVPDVDSQVTLEGGEGSFEVDGTVQTEGFAILGDKFQVAEANGETYVLAHMSFNTGGTGTFDYLVSFVQSDAGLEQVDAEILGDSIIVRSLEFNAESEGSMQATVEIYTREEGESISVEPTVEETLEFTITAEGEIETE
ncbi:MAG: hypothetical protein U5L75_02425 [Candidatus Campbellbacteria bacterium]|nr:hypothetical protein [Candidatus Campbellbacteria bacterium]